MRPGDKLFRPPPEIKQVSMGGGGRAGATFGRCGNLKIRTVSDAPRVGLARIAVGLSVSLPFLRFFAFSGSPALALAGRLGSMFHQHLGLPQY